MVIQTKQDIPLNPLAARKPTATLVKVTIENPPKPPPSKLPTIKVDWEQPKRGRGRPQSGKETVTLRLSGKVVEHFKPHGKHWKQAIDAYLVESLKL
jgi:uncharacterized protein (DUF4415 family)